MLRRDRRPTLEPGSPLADDLGGDEACLLKRSDVDLDPVVDVRGVGSGPAGGGLVLPAAADPVLELVTSLDRPQGRPESFDVFDRDLELAHDRCLAAVLGPLLVGAEPSEPVAGVG